MNKQTRRAWLKRQSPECRTTIRLIARNSARGRLTPKEDALAVFGYPENAQGCLRLGGSMKALQESALKDLGTRLPIESLHDNGRLAYYWIPTPEARRLAKYV